MSFDDDLSEPFSVQSAEHWIAIMRAKSQRWSSDHDAAIGTLPAAGETRVPQRSTGETRD
jgi:hypothetical protein